MKCGTFQPMNASPLHPDPHWSAGVHHDGSALYVSNPAPALDEIVQIRLRVPESASVQQLLLRTMPDGEQHDQPMHPSDTPGFWRAELKLTMPSNSYHFVLKTEGDGTLHYNTLGIARAQWNAVFDFKLLADFKAPDWLTSAVFYEIVPDRFANGNPSLNVPEGVFTRYERYRSQTVAWDSAPRPYAESGGLDFYGGDLPGILQRLDYLQDLGINALYLTPIFKSSSFHRYNIEDFHQVDPYLGGDEALAHLRAALSERAMRLILDVTPNHTGVDHPWFKAAQDSIDAPTAAYYTFYDHPHDYARWLQSCSLAKLNYASAALRDAMYRGDESVLRFWLRPPYAIDGWRLDVFNMMARQGTFQAQAEVAREMRTAIKRDQPNAYLLGESFFDATSALQGDQVDAVMNYAGFAMPLWEWLRGDGFGAEDFAAQAQRFLAAIPWQVARMQFNLLDSHDTPRILHIAGGDKRLVQMAVVLLMAFPGVPCIYYGDEIGLTAAGDPDNRAPMPWEESKWDTDLRSGFKRLIALRRTSSALQEGGFQWLFATGDVLAFQRASPGQHLLIVLCRAQQATQTRLPVWQGGLQDGTKLSDLLSGQTVTAQDGHISLPTLTTGAAYIFEVVQ
jgi:alpha-glucosidase